MDKTRRQRHAAALTAFCLFAYVQGNTEAQFKSVTKKKTEEQFQVLLD